MKLQYLFKPEINSVFQMTNFRRLLLEGADLHKEPPQNPPKDWRLKCQGLLPEGKVMVLKMFIFLRIFYSEADPDLIYIRWGPKRFPGPKKGGGGGFPRSTNVIVLLHIIGRGCGLSRAPLAGRAGFISIMYAMYNSNLVFQFQ